MFRVTQKIDYAAGCFVYDAACFGSGVSGYAYMAMNEYSYTDPWAALAMLTAMMLRGRETTVPF